MKPLLSKKDRTLHPRGQVQKLVRISKRAEAKADWLDELLAGGRSFSGPEDIAATRADRDAARDRSLAAANELCRIVVDNPDAGWTLPQRQMAATWGVER
jgi:hypothetical protein